jgi:hypothetical protein
MQQMYACPNCNSSVVFSAKFCGNCGTQMTWQEQQQNMQSHYDTSATQNNLNWFQRHLNWTYLLWILSIYTCGLIIGLYVNNAVTSNSSIYYGGVWRWAIIPLVIFHIQANIWIIKRKGRNLWWFLPSVIFSPILLLLRNKEMD